MYMSEILRERMLTSCCQDLHSSLWATANLNRKQETKEEESFFKFVFVGCIDMFLFKKVAMKKRIHTNNDNLNVRFLRIANLDCF
jgi:hypothetical protein